MKLTILNSSHITGTKFTILHLQKLLSMIKAHIIIHTIGCCDSLYFEAMNAQCESQKYLERFINGCKVIAGYRTVDLLCGDVIGMRAIVNYSPGSLLVTVISAYMQSVF
ncbi:hypothetical protein WA026_008314 [Henosepilachna vigintioctopunctata]|uniref:Uncharacterized protein n=1 Tax=Henosepilachna vigintioctopunctata TaxID=420089 RepID=A0AAW1TIW3_9CUCU